LQQSEENAKSGHFDPSDFFLGLSIGLLAKKKGK
jgi:hypothetical protein